MRAILSNWKTTLAGIGTTIGGAVLIVNGRTVEGITAILAGIGQILAKDGSIK
jgi:hypothetical protein